MEKKATLMSLVSNGSTLFSTVRNTQSLTSGVASENLHTVSIPPSFQ